ncbi:hypothetical protein ACFYM2_32075 [Streptomyces sp. NPDC006711]
MPLAERAERATREAEPADDRVLARILDARRAHPVPQYCTFNSAL